MFQSWDDLLFAHWPLPAAALRPLVPAALAIEEFDGTAWLAQTPFRLTGMRFRWAPPMPAASTFLEMNLRTYVRFRGRPGIFFFSLDAASRFAVRGARTFYRLPYHLAAMSAERSNGWFRYRSSRLDGVDAELSARYRPAGDVFEPAPGSLEHFLTERYAFFVVLRSGSVLRGDIHHPPWRLQPAIAELDRNTVPAARGIALPDREPLLHYSARQPTLIWPPKRVSRRST